MSGNGMADIAEGIEAVKDDVAQLKRTLDAYCPRDRLQHAGLAVDDIEVGIAKLELAVGAQEGRDR